MSKVKWNKCADVRPTEKGNYLVHCATSKDQHILYFCLKTGWETSVYDELGEDYIEITSHRITHWAELPPNPTD